MGKHTPSSSQERSDYQSPQVPVTSAASTRHRRYPSRAQRVLVVLIAAVWLANGLFCKVFNLVPRHQEIVGRILGNDYSRELTFAIGISEIFMAIWILSRIKPRLNAIAQMLIIIVMNCIEFLLAPDLLLWGKWNSMWAILLVVLIYFNEFILVKKIDKKVLV